MCEATCEAMRVGFDRSIKLEFHGAKVSKDDELVTYRELDQTLQLAATATKAFTSFRTRASIQHELVALLRAAGEADQDRSQGGEALGIRDLPDG